MAPSLTHTSRDCLSTMTRTSSSGLTSFQTGDGVDFLGGIFLGTARLQSIFNRGIYMGSCHGALVQFSEICKGENLSWHHKAFFKETCTWVAAMMPLFNFSEICRGENFSWHHVRHAEFGRACANRMLDSTKIPVHYCGIIGDNLKKLQEGIQSQVYNSWDVADSSPPRDRPRPERANPLDQLQLEVLAVNRGVPCWPDIILSKFHESTEEYKTLLQMKTEFEREFQVSQRNANTTRTSSTQRNRCNGVCDYSVDGGRDPLDVQRVIDLEHVSLESLASENRPGLIFLGTGLANLSFKNDLLLIMDAT